jgi:hypothetical protein
MGRTKEYAQTAPKKKKGAMHDANVAAARARAALTKKQPEKGHREIVSPKL